MSDLETLSLPTTKLKLSSLACNNCRLFWGVLYESNGADDILAHDEGNEEMDSSVDPAILTLSHVQRGKTENCSLCTLVYDLLELNGDSDDASAIGFIDIETIRVDERDGLTILYGEDEWDDSFKSFDLFILPEAPVQFDNLSMFYDISEDPLSNSCQHMILGWIEECITTHAVCSSPALVQAPKRLIDVGESDKYCVRLVSPSPSEVLKYAALTHCWGGSNPTSTTTINYISRYDGIPSTEIPRTFEDAIKITRWLGLKYLWIDSFCIVQDDKTEWETEAAKMADIYSGSWVVIAAAQANDSSAGFLHPRESARHMSLKLPHRTAVDICVRRRIGHDTSSANRIPSGLLLSPLLQRAWCFQERILAPRILYFDEREYIFHCQQEERCECGSISRSEENPVGTRWLGLRMNSKSPHFHFGILWGTIVQEYSDLKLTFETDRLPALAGIARFVEKFTPGRYLAGIWEKDLPYQLLWYVQIGGDGISVPSIDEPLSRADIYAPSFSWISWTQKVYYDGVPDDFLVACDVEEVLSTTPGANEYGQVSYAHIKIRGLLISLETIYSRICLLEHESSNREISVPAWQRKGRPHISCDFHRSNDWNKFLFFKLLTSKSLAYTENEVSNKVYGLVLEETDIPGTYKRFGLAMDIPESWIDSSAALTMVTIV